MMKLVDIMAPYPLIELSKGTEGSEILEFLNRIEMKTKKLNIKYDRSPDFFSFSKLQAEKYFVFLFRNIDKSLQGMAIFSFRKMNVNGISQFVGYGSDLRVSQQASKLVRLQWRKLYAEIIKNVANIEEFGGTKFVITSVFDENREAIQSFVKKSDSSKRDLIYHPYHPYRSINIYARLPKKNLSSVSLYKKINLDFLNKNNEKTQLTFENSEIERLNSFLHFREKNWLTYTRDNKIIACAFPWSDLNWRRLIISNLPFAHQILGYLLPLFGRTLIRNCSVLNIAHIGFFKSDLDNANDKSKIQLDFINKYWKEVRNLNRIDRPHIISIKDSLNSNLPILLKKQGYLFDIIPASIYQVIHADNYTDANLLKYENNSIPDFELGLA